jgi:archaetidylinositol phosphate synthase
VAGTAVPEHAGAIACSMTERPTFVPSAAAKARPRSEAIMLVVQPVASIAIRLLARARVDPQAVVWSHTLLGAAAAVSIAVTPSGVPNFTAALLLQAKTLLDNVDGGLARATKQVTEMGRYLDTVLDTLVNAALFAAIARHAPDAFGALQAAVAFLLLMAMLSLDFNLERRYRALRGARSGDDAAPPGAPAAVLALFRGFYERVLAPQDRWIDRLDEAAFRRLRGRAYAAADATDRLAWNDLWSSATLVNLGLSTQLLVLGICLAAGHPFAYVGCITAMAAYVVVIQGVRALRFRRWVQR